MNTWAASRRPATSLTDLTGSATRNISFGRGDALLMKERRRRALGITISFMVGLCAVLGGLALVGDRNHSRSLDAPALTMPSGAPPIIGAVEVSLAAAESVAPFPLLLPSDPNANTDNLTQIWWSPPDQEMALLFGQDSAVEILMSPSTTDNPGGSYQEFLDQNLSKASIETVQGQPALVIEPGTDYPGTNPAFVRVTLDNVDVAIQSHTLSDSDLLQIAESLSPTLISAPTPAVSPS
jgi:hypothetical protein